MCALRRTRRPAGPRARQTQGREGGRREAAGARSSLTLARGGVACRDRSPRGAAAGASSCWPRGRRRGPARRPAPRTQDGCAGPGVPTSGGRGGYHASADGPRPSRVLVPADRATLRLWLLCKPPAIRTLSHALPAGAGQEPDPERGRRGAADGREGGREARRETCLRKACAEPGAHHADKLSAHLEEHLVLCLALHLSF